ncbi:MAG: outer membrane lipoprotein carrier protein LolA [Leptospiraceae bacterium]|nr:outer membrane lipoprotein carrier protein LolA [Leptospiraceae bacterium]
MYKLLLLIILSPAFLSAQAHNWNSPSEVVKKVKKKYSDIQTISANFSINIVNGKKEKNMTGSCQYKNPGKIRYDFTNPNGDAIVSDGKTLWIYIKRIGAAGKQDLELDKKNSSGEPIFSQNTASGLKRLFRKYHYKFDSINQPQKGEDGKDYFVLALEQREKIGGFETMTLFIDAKEYFVKKAIGRDSRGKETTITYTKLVFNSDIEDGAFKYHVSGNAKIVNNPLVSAPAPPSSENP